MGFLSWLRGRTSPSYRASRLYHRGVARANAHRYAAAIDDYSNVLDMPGAAPNLRAMALYNRALAHSAMQHETAALADLNHVLDMGDAAGHVKTEARRKLIRMERSSGRADATHAASSPKTPESARTAGRTARAHTPPH